MLAADVVKRMLFGRGGLYERARDCAAVVFRALEEGGRRGAEVAVILAVIGILVEVLTVTGFAQKLSGAMLELAADMYELSESCPGASPSTIE